MQTPSEEIKSRLDIVDVVREYIPQLKEVGANWKANCPFHAEKTPSFMVSKEKQIWHCFGCGEGGDVFSFVQKIEGVEFAESLRILAKKAGVVLKRQDPKLLSQKNRLVEVCEIAANVYNKILLESEKAGRARKYLKERGLLPETIEDFKIGYALDSWDSLSRFLLDKGFSDNELFLAGLVVKKEGGSGFYDRFRNRIIFPIVDLHGSTVGFTARQMPGSEDKMGKYVNTPQTMIYDKGRILYGLDKAKKSIRENDLVVVVEGQMDVIASHQAGVKNVIASSGTALTIDQIKLLKRYTENIALSFDLDAAGEVAAKRGIENALREGMNIKVIQIPKDFGKDPDDCIRKDSEVWKKAVLAAVPFMQYYFDQTTKGLDLAEVENKKQVAKILLAIISKIPNKIEQTHWLQKLANILGVTEQILREQISQIKVKKVVETKEQPKSSSIKPRELLIGERLLALVLKYPNSLKSIIDNLAPEMISDDFLQNLYKKLIIFYNKEGFEDIDDLKKHFVQDKDLSEKIDVLLLLADKDFSEFNEDLARDEITKMVDFLKKNYISKRLKEIEEQIRLSEDSKSEDADKIKTLVKEFNRLTEELSQIN